MRIIAILHIIVVCVSAIVSVIYLLNIMIKNGERGVAWMESIGWLFIFVVSLGHGVLLIVHILCLNGSKKSNKEMLIPFMVFKTIWTVVLIGGGIVWMYHAISTGLAKEGISTENMIPVFKFFGLVMGAMLNVYCLVIVAKLCIEIDTFITSPQQQEYEEPFI